jgi:hypothetical protein
MLRGRYRSKRRGRTFTQEYLATATASAMFPTVGLKSIKKPVVSGFDSRTEARPDGRQLETLRGGGSWFLPEPLAKRRITRTRVLRVVNNSVIVFSGVR